MSIKPLIDYIRFRADVTGAKIPMSRARDLIANLLFDRSYSAAIAAERAGRLPNPELVPSRTSRLRTRYGASVDVIADIATAIVLGGRPTSALGRRELAAVIVKHSASPDFWKDLKRRFGHTSLETTLRYFYSTSTHLGKSNSK